MLAARLNFLLNGFTLRNWQLSRSQLSHEGASDNAPRVAERGGRCSGVASSGLAAGLGRIRWRGGCRCLRPPPSAPAMTAWMVALPISNWTAIPSSDRPAACRLKFHDLGFFARLIWSEPATRGGHDTASGRALGAVRAGRGAD